MLSMNQDLMEDEVNTVNKVEDTKTRLRWDHANEQYWYGMYDK